MLANRLGPDGRVLKDDPDRRKGTAVQAGTREARAPSDALQKGCLAGASIANDHKIRQAEGGQPIKALHGQWCDSPAEPAILFMLHLGHQRGCCWHGFLTLVRQQWW